ncbi:MAG: hypothetical protein ORN22_06645 [Opitutales bacterium]|nr:hypothetical protein [Opitutales bacterium]
MKHLPLLLIAALGFAAEEAPRPNFRPEGSAPEGRALPRLPVQLSPDEQKRLHEAMEKANQDPAVKEAHEQAAAEAQKKARDITDEAARKADPSVAPILEKVRKAMEQRQPGRQPEAQPRGEAPRQREGNREQPANRGAQFPGLTPDEQQKVREAMAKANAEPAVREAREAAALAQRKAMEIAEDVARKADPSLAPLLEKMHKAFEARRPEGEGQRGRKQPE